MTPSAKFLMEYQAGAALAALSPVTALIHAELMEKMGPGFVLRGATAEELLEWKASIRYLRVVIAGQSEKTDG